jgi:MSHA biogenesis protein MshN
VSVVNKMLRDLDARRIGDAERSALPAAVTPMAAHRERSLSPWVFAMGGLAAVVTLGGLAWYWVPGSPAPTAAMLPMEPPRVPPSVAIEAPASVPSAATAGPAAPESAVVATAPARPAMSEPALRLDDQLATAPALKALQPPAATQPQVVVPAPKPSAKAAAAPRPTASGRIPEGTPSGTIGAAPVAAPAPPPAPPSGRIEKMERIPTGAERAESDYRGALQAKRQGDLEKSMAGFRAALANLPEHADARQSLAALLIESRRFDEAEELLRNGTELAPVRLASTLALARLKVERNQLPAALELLLKNQSIGEGSADYQGFAGALLNRAGRSTEAVDRYRAATRLAPGDGRWWAGLGIALDGAGRTSEAREAYGKARGQPGLPADLAQHVEQRLR